MAATAFPTAAINTLLDMVRGVTPFNLVTAIQAALEIATYLKSVFGTQSVASVDSGMSLEDALVAASKHGAAEVEAEAIPAALLTYIIQLILQWIAGKLNPTPTA